MKLKVAVVVVLLIAALYLANRFLAGGNLSRGSLETVETSNEVRDKFTVGFLPVT
jgi:hypothetical protein